MYNMLLHMFYQLGRDVTYQLIRCFPLEGLQLIWETKKKVFSQFIHQRHFDLISILNPNTEKLHTLKLESCKILRFAPGYVVYISYIYISSNSTSVTNLRELQYAKIWETSSVVFGFSSILLVPLYQKKKGNSHQSAIFPSNSLDSQNWNQNYTNCDHKVNIKTVLI